MVVLFSVAEFISGCFGINHDTLTPAFIGVFGGELLMTCILKLLEKDKNDDNTTGNDTNSDGMEDNV